jgi:hypothetical protein
MTNKESVVDLLVRTQTDTVLVPLFRMQRLERPLSPSRAVSPNSRWATNSSVGRDSFDEKSLSTYSIRSYDSGLSYSSFSIKSSVDYTLRDRIKEVEEKVRSHSNREELPAVLVPPSLCSWDNRVAKKYQNRPKPPINIIGCHQPSDLIVARADDRIRKQVNAKEMREKHMSELSRYIDHLIQMKLTRGERYALQLEEQKRQSVLLKIVFICNYIKAMTPMIEAVKKHKERDSSTDKAARFLQRGMSVWYEDRVSSRYTTFEAVMSKYKWRLQLSIRIAQKRRAARIITSYLVQKKDKRGQMSSIIHQFLSGVRRIQRMSRGFLECKLYRIRCLEKIWVDLEKQYIYAAMVVKRAEVTQNSSTKSQSLVIDIKTRIEMDKQNERWDFTSKKFDRILDFHRTKGDLDVSIEAEGIDSLLVPIAERRENLEEMLHQKRKEHILKLQDMQRQLKTSCLFCEDDALSFLKGHSEPGFRVNMSDYAQLAMKVMYPFNVYKNLSDDEFLSRMKQIHHQRKTFEITPQNVNLFNSALQNQPPAKKNINGERVILRRSASVNIKSYEEHDSIIRVKLIDASIDSHKDVDHRKKRQSNQSAHESRSSRL